VRGQIGARGGLEPAVQAASIIISSPRAVIDGLFARFCRCSKTRQQTWSYYRGRGRRPAGGLFEPNAARGHGLDAIPEGFFIRRARTRLGADDPAFGSGIQNAFLRLQRPVCASSFLRPGELYPDLAPLRGECAGVGQLLGAAGDELAGNSYGPVSARRCPLGFVDGRCRSIQHPRSTMTDLPMAAHNTPAFRRAGRLNLLARKSFGAQSQTDTSKTARGRSVRRSMTGSRPPWAYFSESHGWELPDWFAPGHKKSRTDRATLGSPELFDWLPEDTRPHVKMQS